MIGSSGDHKLISDKWEILVGSLAAQVTFEFPTIHGKAAGRRLHKSQTLTVQT